MGLYFQGVQDPDSPVVPGPIDVVKAALPVIASTITGREFGFGMATNTVATPVSSVRPCEGATVPAPGAGAITEKLIVVAGIGSTVVPELATTLAVRA
jgi:hypothetical protein